MAYSEKVIDHYNNPRNVGSFKVSDKDVGTGLVGAPECGDVMKLQLKINEQGVIEDANHMAFGRGGSYREASLITGSVLTFLNAVKAKNCLKPASKIGMRIDSK